jgi:4-amino-4-deoxy-L-arabinose transferase-like glycosyltransferase
VALATRLPSFVHPLWNPDEGYLAVQARMLAAGGHLYETVVDRKPPLVPWLYHGAFAVFGSGSLTSVRLLAVLAHLLTAVFLASLARRRWGAAAGRTAGVLYLLVSVGLNPEDAQAAGFEVFILPCTVAALWSADRGRFGTAGFAVAAAVLAKQTGGAVLLPVLWLCCASPAVQRRGEAPYDYAALRANLLRLGAGVLLPLVAAALLTDPSGFLYWTVTGSRRYVSLAGSAPHMAARALAGTALLALACAGLLLPVAKVVRRTRVGTPDLWLWLAVSAGAVMTGGHFFGHYFLQLVPPLVLVATAALCHLSYDEVRTALMSTACCCALFLTWALLVPRADLTHAQRLAGAIAHRTGPDDRVLVWGMHPETYWLADRTPATRYLTAGLLTNYSGGRDGAEVGEKYGMPGSWHVFLGEMATAPPELIVDDSHGKPYRPSRLPDLRRLLGTSYERAGTVDGSVLYRRLAVGRP